MTSIIAKVFLGIFATMIAHRIIATLLGIAIGFLIYKYFTDPKYIVNLFNNLKGIFESFKESGLSKPEDVKETVALLF